MSDDQAMAMMCLQELWIRFDNTLYALRKNGEWQERIDTMRKSHDDIWERLHDFIRGMSGKEETLNLLSDLQARYTFTLDLLSERWDKSEAIDWMRKVFSDITGEMRDLIIAM